MNKIESIDLTRLRIEEVFGFHKQVEVKTELLTQESDKAMIDAYKATVAIFSEALYGTSKNPYSKASIQADEQTDATWRGIRAHTKAMLRYPTQEAQQAAEQVYDIISKYGDLARMGHNEKYGALYNLLQELTQIEAQKQKAIFIEQWIVELQANYNSYMAITDARTQVDANVETGLAKESRDNARAAYYAFVERVNALALINGHEPYMNFIKNTNQLIELTKTTLVSRNSRAAQEKEEPTTDSQ